MAGAFHGLRLPTTPKTPLQALQARLERLEGLLELAALPSGYLHTKDVLQRYAISRSTFNRWRRAGRLPEPVKLSAGCLWRLCDLEAMEKAGQVKRPLMRIRIEERDPGPTPASVPIYARLNGNAVKKLSRPEPAFCPAPL